MGRFGVKTRIIIEITKEVRIRVNRWWWGSSFMYSLENINTAAEIVSTVAVVGRLFWSIRMSNSTGKEEAVVSLQVTIRVVFVFKIFKVGRRRAETPR